MQIILAQNEIELALTEYIHRQINVREGMHIEIDLAATRGQQGFTAMIDIVPDAPAPAVAVSRPAVRSITRTKEAPVVAQEAPSAIEVPVQQELPIEAPVVQEVKAEVPAVEDDAAVDAVMQTTANKRPSLFGGLAKPVNS